MERRDASQAGINRKIDALSKYLTVDLKYIEDIDAYNITYSNLNPSTLPLAMEHFQYLILSLMTGSHLSSSIDEIDGLMTRVLRECAKESFRIHYVYDPGRPKNLPLQELRINLTFGLLDENQEESKHTLEKIFRIRNVDKFKTLLNYYEDLNFQGSTPLQPSSAYEYLHDYTTYRNTLQVRMDKVLYRLRLLLPSLYIKEDKDDSSILDIDYGGIYQSQLPLIIRHLELLIRTFKTGNDDTNDNTEVDRFLSEIRNDIYPLVEDRSFGSFYRYYNDRMLRGKKPINSNTFFKLSLNIILKKHQYNFTKTLHLEGSESFKILLDLFNYLSDDYLILTNFPHNHISSYKDLLYIADKNKDDSYILNLYYYPLSNDLDIFLIMDHFIIMIDIFQREFSANSNDNDIIDHYLISIIHDLISIDTNRSIDTKTPQLSIFIPSHFSISFVSSTSFQYHFITQYNNKLAVSSPTNITINLILLLRDSRSISNTYGLALTNTDQLLSLLNHYSLSRDPLDPSWMEGYKEHKDLYGEISRRGKLQTSLDGSLSRLPRDISFKVRKDDSDPYNVEVGYPNLEISSIPYAMKHLELMMLMYRTWNHSSNDKLEIDTFLFQAKEDVERGYSSSIKDPMDNMLDELHARMDSMLAWSNDGSISLEGSKVSSRDEKDNDKKDDDSRDIPPQAFTGIGKDASLPGDVRAIDGRLGGASANFPDLLEVVNGDISMMEDVD